MFKAFVTGFLRNDPPPTPQEIDFQGVNVKVSYLQFKKNKECIFLAFSW